MQVTCKSVGALSSSSSLTTIPPELLLRIISFLPGPSAFVSLAQTSAGLRKFICQHASGICNEHIRSHFFSPTASVFQCYLQDGWLVPGDREFWGEEEEFLSRKTKCHAVHRARLEATLKRSIDNGVIPDCYNKWHYRSVGTEHLLCDSDNSYQEFLLSKPGPLYLAYLEEYAGDVQNFEWLSHSVDEDEDEDEDPSSQDLLRRLTGLDTRWRVSTYTTRPFMRKVDAAIMNDCGCCAGSMPYARRSRPPMLSTSTSSGLAQRVLARSGLKWIFPSAVKEKEPTARLLFGEFVPELDDDTPKKENKWGLGKESRSAVLLWTIVTGREERLTPPSINETIEPSLKERKVRLTNPRYLAIITQHQD
jgi:hypothetical protein